MGVNKYFDESLIIKKPTPEKEQPSTPIETIPEVVPEKEEPGDIIIEDFDQEDITIPDQNFNVEVDINKRRDEYKNIITQHNNKEEKPIYNISRENGTVKIEPQNKPTEIIEKEEVKPLTHEDIYKAELEKIKQTNQMNIVKAEIEINVYKQLIRNEAKTDKNKTYQMRLDNFINELDFYKKRQSILEKM